MELQFGEQYERLRQDVRRFARDAWPLRGEEARRPPREQEILFRRRAIAAGFLARMVPTEYGGAGVETDVFAETIIRRELEQAGTPWRTPTPHGTDMLVPTLLEEGSPEQCARYIPGTLVGEIVWCQGYSEPGAGSDLASLQARATLDGDEWVLNGQKVWTSSAVEANHMFGLFRSEPDEPRHGGISYFLIPMSAPGIEVRPLRQMNGGEEFCEVFFDDVRIAADGIVGARGAGWRVSKATLKHERLLIGDSSYLRRAFDDLIALARATERGGQRAITEPHVRQRLAEIEGFVATQEWASYRMLSAIARDQDMTAISEMMMTKLYLTDTMQRIARCALDLLGEEGLREPAADEATMRTGWETPGHWVSQYMLCLGIAIAGGTSNIQRNLIGERLLGLPRDLRRDSPPR